MSELSAYTIRFEPSGLVVTCDGPCNLLQAAQEAGVEIVALCGGAGSCGRCRVLVQSDDVSRPSATEQRLFTPAELEAGYRLACRAVVQGETVVTIPASSQPHIQRLQVEGQLGRVEPAPPLSKWHLEAQPPTLQDTTPDLARLDAALRRAGGGPLRRVDYALLPAVGRVLRHSDWRVTLTLREGELLRVEPGDTRSALYGVAVDLGSTKIAVYLVDLINGETVAAQGVMNPQAAYGEDIMTRIGYALDHEDGAARLRHAVLEAINDTVRQLTAAHGLSPDDVAEIVVVGNTAMHHFLLGLPVEQLALAPFVPVSARPLLLKARQVGLDAAPGAYLYTPPLIAGFVGADHVAMLLAARFASRDDVCLGIDIGTNTEISLKKGDRISAVSCASGPAFEGAAIRWGMKAAPGAIERVWIDPDSRQVQVTTIGNEPPVGICGSGILDSIAAMRQATIMDARGRIQAGVKGVRSDADGKRELVLAAGADGEITITQLDVRSIQLAKGAIRSGIDVLLDAMQVAVEEIDSVVLAGAFGTFIDPLAAVQTGLLPPVPLDRIEQVGNGAGAGARAMLLSTAQREMAERLASQVRYLELTTYPGYSDFFMRALQF